MDKAYLWEKLGNNVQAGLLDKSVTEVILNPDGRLWFMKQSRYHEVGTIDIKDAEAFVHAFAQYQQQYLNRDNPVLDGTLPFNGERINITTEPLHPGVAFNIRKMSPVVYTLKDYLKRDIISANQEKVIKAAISAQKNILISGGPATGKTTFANALLDEVANIAPVGHRALILEQVPELQCRLSNCKRLLTHQSYDLRKLLWIAMRNSPERIVIGEVRDGAALEMLKAWNTGCSSGGIATIHANSPQAAVQRVLDLSLEVTSHIPYTLAAESLQVIVQLETDHNHPAGRRLQSIAEIQGFDPIRKQFQFNCLEKNNV